MSLVALMLVALVPSEGRAQAAEGRGGFMGFIAGCCFGIRAGVDYNAGMDIHWREWGRIVPYVGIVFSLWDGIEVAGGLTRSELSEKYGSQFY